MGNVIPFSGRKPFRSALIDLIDQYKQELVGDVVMELRLAADTLARLDSYDGPPPKRSA
jgi:hypothetical protein